MEKILVTRSSMPSFDEYIEEIRDIWDSHWLTNMGTHYKELKEKLKEYLKVEDIALFTNGHMALELLLQAMGLEGEVITTPFTFASTTHAIVRNGLTPVFCDIDPETYTIDVNKIEELITDKTCAIVPVHVYGQPCDVDAIEKIAKKHNLKVIYDAAHTFGVEIDGRGITSYGDASMLSFHATKAFNTIEGGAVCFSDEKIGSILYRLHNFGIMNEETVDYVGANAKMNEFQAAMGVCNLRHIEEELLKRQAVFERYQERLSGIKGITLMKLKDNVKYNYAYYPVLFDKDILGVDRNEISDALKEQGIFSRKYFYPLCNEFECYRDKYDVMDTPVAYKISRQVLTLPMFADLPLSDVDRICDVIISRIG